MLNKYILILAALFVTTSIFAQKNEIALSYQAFQYDAFGIGTSLSYYRQISPKSALGIRLAYNGMGKNWINSYDYSKNISLDLVNRWTLTKGTKFRVFTEMGVSTLKRYIPSTNHVFGWCGNSTPQEINRMLARYEKQRINYIGFTSSLGVDFQVLKYLNIGVSYLFKAYLTNNTELNEELRYLSNLSVNANIKF